MCLCQQFRRASFRPGLWKFTQGSTFAPAILFVHWSFRPSFPLPSGGLGQAPQRLMLSTERTWHMAGARETVLPGIRSSNCCCKTNHPKPSCMDSCVMKRVRVRTSDHTQQGKLVCNVWDLDWEHSRAGDSATLPGIIQRHPVSQSWSGRAVDRNTCTCPLSLGLGCLTLQWPQTGKFPIWKLRVGGQGVSQTIGGNHIAFADLALKGTPCHFCSVLSVTSKSHVLLDSRRWKLDSASRWDGGEMRF